MWKYLKIIIFLQKDLIRDCLMFHTQLQINLQYDLTHFTVLHPKLICSEEEFNLDVDEIFESIIGMDIYEARSHLNNVTDTAQRQHLRQQQTKRNQSRFYKNIRQQANLSSYDNKRQFILTEEEMKIKRMKLRFAVMLCEQQSALDINYNTFDNDKLKQSYRRGLFSNLWKNIKKAAEELQKEVEKTAVYLAEEGLKAWDIMVEWYNRKPVTFDTRWDSLNATIRANAKRRLINLMHQFVYETRYKLPYMQKLRLKYINSRRYQIGYLFSLLRSCLHSQQWLYSMLARYYNTIGAVVNQHFFLQMYESAIRYNMEVIDLIKYIRKLEYERKMHYDPEYYDERPYGPDAVD